jgi:hypothetical protein
VRILGSTAQKPYHCPVVRCQADQPDRFGPCPGLGASPLRLAPRIPTEYPYSLSVVACYSIVRTSPAVRTLGAGTKMEGRIVAAPRPPSAPLPPQVSQLMRDVGVAVKAAGVAIR